LAAHIGGEVGAEWIPTLIFYAAIHLIEAELADRGLHPEGHAARARLVEDMWDEGAADLFEALRDLSEQWRYSGRAPNDSDVEAAKAWAAQLLASIGASWPVEGFLPTT
jgi:hypothetical protein